MGVTDFSVPVHRSLHQRDLLAGVPHIALLVLLMFGIVTVYMAQLYWFTPVVIVLYIVMRLLTKRDPFLLDIIFISIVQDDYLIP